MSIEKGDATKYVHTGNGELCYELNKALTVPETFPIYLSSAYIFDSIDPIDKICDEGAPGYAYFRLGNPNADATSQILATGDGAEKGLVFSSGMAAITTSILATVKPGDHIVASPIIYGEAFYYLKYELKRWGVETTFIDFNTQDVADYIRPNTKLVYGETIANPLMSVPDIQHLADVAHANGAKLFIDNTFATSIIAKPIKYGADLVIYSATKYLGGHDDLVGGAVVGSEEIIKSLSFYLGLYGANLGATESWLLARSLRTLPLRVKKMAENGLALAKFFESHPKVEKVYYPGLESSPSKALADKQFEGNGYGGMLCVNFKGGQKEIDKLISNLQLVRFVPTLAGVGTTLTYPPRASHRDLSPDELAAIGITMGQIRLSSGLEDTDDLLNDFDQALAKM
ncbi:MAG: trans-sulfuration enzyme family protein [Dysosmobacter sp.]|jgi:aluminum resistance protein